MDSFKIYSGLSFVKSNHWKPIEFIAHTSCASGHKKTVLGKNLFQLKVSALISLPSPP